MAKVWIKMLLLSSGFSFWTTHADQDLLDCKTGLKLDMVLTPDNLVYTGNETVEFSCSLNVSKCNHYNIVWYQGKKTVHTWKKKGLNFVKTIQKEDHDTEIYCIYINNEKTNRFSVKSKVKKLCVGNECSRKGNFDKVVSLRIGELFEYVCNITSIGKNAEIVRESADNYTRSIATNNTEEILTLSQDVKSSDNNSIFYCVSFFSENNFNFYIDTRIKLNILDEASSTKEQTKQPDNLGPEVLQPVLTTQAPEVLQPFLTTQAPEVLPVETNDLRSQLVYIVIPLVIVLSVLLGLLYYFCRRRRRQPGDGVVPNNEAVVTYADIEVLQTTYRLPTREETPYAEIIGVLKSRKQKNTYN